MNVSREELAWAAGFIDGEGSFNWNVTRAGYGVPRFGLNQVDSEPVERLLAVFPFLGLSIRQREHSHYQDQWYVWANGYERVQAILAMTWPWLSEFKRQAAVKVLRRFREQSLTERKAA